MTPNTIRSGLFAMTIGLLTACAHTARQNEVANDETWLGIENTPWIQSVAQQAAEGKDPRVLWKFESDLYCDQARQRIYKKLGHYSRASALLPKEGTATATRNVTPSDTIEDLQVTSDRANPILVRIMRDAVSDSAPFPPWSDGMRKYHPDGTLRAKMDFIANKSKIDPVDRPILGVHRNFDSDQYRR